MKERSRQYARVAELEAPMLADTMSTQSSMQAPPIGKLRAAHKLFIHALRTRSSLSAQGARFAISGCVVALVYLLTTTVLAFAVGMPFELALAIGFLTAICVHFNLQRLFVWAHHEKFALPVRRQLSRYLPLQGLQYCLTAISTSLLPSRLGLPVEIVYLATAMSISLVNFLMFRHRIFYGKPSVPDTAAASGTSLPADPRGLEAQRGDCTPSECALGRLDT